MSPVEQRVWPLVDEPLANRVFRTLAEVETVLDDRCVRLPEMPGVIRSHTRFGWWSRSRQRMSGSPKFRITRW